MIRLINPNWRDGKIWEAQIVFDCSCANCLSAPICKNHDDLCEFWMPSLFHFDDFRFQLCLEIKKQNERKQIKDACKDTIDRGGLNEV